MKFYITFAIVSLTMILNFAPSNRVLDKLALRTILQFLEWNVDTTKAIAQSDNTQRSNTDTTIIDRSSIGSNLSVQEVQQLLRLHNKVRGDVGVAPVTWSKKPLTRCDERFQMPTSNHKMSTKSSWSVA